MPDGGHISIQRTPDFARIVSLPRRRFTWEQAERDAAELTPELVTPLGKKAGVSLRPLQGFVLRELWEHRGVYASISVGAGKTLLSFLAAYVMNAKRPILVVPENLIEKTGHEFQEYRKHWLEAGKPPRLVGYRELTRVDNVDLLEKRLKPDFIIFDEVDVLANQDGSATKRFDRYIAETGVPVLAMTGTDGRFSIKDFSHFLVWTLKGNAPIPLDYDELERWAQCLDEKRPGPKGMMQGAMMPGELLKLIPEGLNEDTRGMLKVAIARAMFQMRMAETPGVVMLDDDDCDQPLTIRHVCAPESAVLEPHFDRLKLENMTPDCVNPRTGELQEGYDLEGPLEKNAKESELGCGFTFIFDPPPPEEWRNKRRTFARFVRRKIDETATWARGQLDTELAVKKKFPDHPAVAEWLAIEPTFKPRSLPVWLDGSVIDTAAAWARKQPGLVWVQHTPVGEALAQLTGLPYYGPKGLTAAGASILRIDHTKSAILSVAANFRGRNLQAFNRALLVGCPPSAKLFEQLIGREHRPGQKRPVTVEILLTSGLSEYAFDMIRKEAKFVKSVRGKTQKVLRAHIERTKFPSDAERWARKPVT